MPADTASPTAAVRAAEARARADARLLVAMGDMMLPDDGRLDEQTRLAVIRSLTDAIGAIETDLRRQAARLLAARGATEAAESLLRGTGAAGRLMAAGLLRDEPLIATLTAHSQARLLAAALPVTVSETEEASLLVRLAAVPDRLVAAAAHEMLVADAVERPTLPAEVQHRLVWAVAAAIRPPTADADLDRAIAEAALRALGAHDEGVGAARVAMNLAQAIDARPEELAPLLLEALGDRRLALFVAVLAHAVGLDFARTQALILDPAGERLWLALRAARLDRRSIAGIALALSDADPRRDIEAFADDIDRIAAIKPSEARSALAPETLEPDFRSAIQALARGARR
ncbi:DUF2336 domain-containing protein [Sphingomonas sp.]|uniref:DUF2336 domain-containing protein n=1 Tax=Sphingomonas sp. TaxID=28214 RepID=UPI003B00A720